MVTWDFEIVKTLSFLKFDPEFLQKTRAEFFESPEFFIFIYIHTLPEVIRVWKKWPCSTLNGFRTSIPWRFQNGFPLNQENWFTQFFLGPEFSHTFLARIFRFSPYISSSTTFYWAFPQKPSIKSKAWSHIMWLNF